MYLWPRAYAFNSHVSCKYLVITHVNNYCFLGLSEWTNWSSACLNISIMSCLVEHNFHLQALFKQKSKLLTSGKYQRKPGMHLSTWKTSIILKNYEVPFTAYWEGEKMKKGDQLPIKCKWLHMNCCLYWLRIH
jgi:hypothetical protein